MRSSRRPSSVTLLALGLLLAGLALLPVAAVWPEGSGPRAVATVGRPVAPPAVARPAVLPRGLRVLLAWDRLRASAYSRGDAAALRGLYLPGSATGRADVRVLRAYAARGLRLHGLGTQVLSCDPVRGSPGRMRLLVTDRVVAGRVVGRGGSARLPGDRATRREITFVRTGGRWVVAEVRTPARRR